MRTLRYPSFVGNVRIMRHFDGVSARVTCLSCGLNRLVHWSIAASTAETHNCLRAAQPDSDTEGVMLLTWPEPVLGVRTGRLFHGRISAPGGWRKRGEDAVTGAFREWREETGLGDSFLTTRTVIPFPDWLSGTTTTVVVADTGRIRAADIARHARSDAGLHRWNVWRAETDPVDRLHPTLIAALRSAGMGGLLEPQRDSLHPPPFTWDNLAWVEGRQPE